MSSAIGIVIILALLAVAVLVFVKIFKNTDLLKHTESEAFNTDRDTLILLKDLILAAEAKVNAASINGVGEQVKAVRVADTNILCISQKIHESLTKLP